MVQPVDVLDPAHRRDRGPRAGRDQDALGGQDPVADGDRLRVDEPALARDRVVAGVLEPFSPRVLGPDEPVLPGLEPREVERRLAGLDAELGGDLARVV